MTDKYKATAEKCGHIIAVYVEGDHACLWMRMYLDCRNGQMTCDSDIGHFACVMPINAYPFSHNLRKTEWLLRKCVNPFDMKFNVIASENFLREIVREGEGDLDGLESVLMSARGYEDNSDAWIIAVDWIAKYECFDLPYNWTDCVIRYYTEQQKRFAEICRDVIAPEVERVMQE